MIEEKFEWQKIIRVYYDFKLIWKINRVLCKTWYEKLKIN